MSMRPQDVRNPPPILVESEQRDRLPPLAVPLPRHGAEVGPIANDQPPISPVRPIARRPPEPTGQCETRRRIRTEMWSPGTPGGNGRAVA